MIVLFLSSVIALAIITRLEERRCSYIDVSDQHLCVEDIYKEMNINLSGIIEAFIPHHKHNAFFLVKDFLVADNRKYARKQRKENSVTLVTQTTVNHLHGLEMLSKSWNGPISVSVLVFNDKFETTIMELFRYFYLNPRIKENVSFHLVIAKQPSNFGHDMTKKKEKDTLGKI